MPRKLIVVGVAAVIALSGSAPVFALQSNTETQRGGIVNKLEQTVESTVTTTENTTKTVTDNVTNRVDRLQTQQERIDARKAELQERMTKRISERKEKLEGRRLAICQNRQDNINTLLDKSAAVGQAKLARIQRFEEGIKKFYVDQALTSESYDAVARAVDEKEAQAIAALDTMVAEEYDCASVDGADPADSIKSARETKRVALKEYRDSVQELLKVVREAFAVKAEAQDETE